MSRGSSVNSGKNTTNEKPPKVCVVLCQYSNPHLTAPKYAPASSFRFQMLPEKGHANLSFRCREKAAVEEFNKRKPSR